MKAFDLTPDPKVLIALTHTPLKPLDALSELLDNAIDSFTIAQNSGNPIDGPLVLVKLPSGIELRQNKGLIRVRDNGPGMSPEMTEKALRAGFTGNNPYDSLGLFGMGLNIASGKLGSRTTMITARKEDQLALKIVIDLIEIQENRSFQVIPEEIDKPEGFKNGTLIEVSEWWPEGNSNYGFIRKLIGYGRPRIREEIGRRYSSLIREKKVRILIDDEPCEFFEHCIWGDNRFVERRGHGKISAVLRFSETLGSHSRCIACYGLIPSGETVCQVCSSASLRTIQELVQGWVGIQRFDDTSHYGIDLIRNGRVIRLLEKSAFFDFTDEFGNIIKDYPADSQYGRIVGEVHLDHVPVDFLKQDFQRSSPEWQRVMVFLRGDSSLQPSQPGADENNSPVFQLYQGYRRVRRFGTQDMYMGYWDELSKSAKRINRRTEQEFLNKFKQRLPGFYDDTEWWKLVESADTPPVEELIECLKCGAENLQSTEVCQVCSAILAGKACIQCGEEIPVSAVSCPQCGKSQIPEVEEPWICQICGKTNLAVDDNCNKCDSLRGAENPLSQKYLKENSDYEDTLSIQGCSIKLADGTQSHPIDVDCCITRKPIIGLADGARLPIVVYKSEKIELFIDMQHSIFHELGLKPEELISGEIAYYIHVANGRLSGSVHNTAHSLSNIKWNILKNYWDQSLSDGPDQVHADIVKFFKDVQQRLAIIFGDSAVDLFNELTEEDKKQLVDNLIEGGEDISEMGNLKSSGKFLHYISPHTIIDLFKRHTSHFFDGAVWSQPYSSIPEIPNSVMEKVREETKSIYLNCLEDCSAFISTQKLEPILIPRTRSSLKYLLRKLES